MSTHAFPHHKSGGKILPDFLFCLKNPLDSVSIISDRENRNNRREKR